MNNITPETFLQTVLPAAELAEGRALWSIKHESGKWSNRYLHNRGRPIPVGTTATYYCVSSVRQNPDYPRRSRTDVLEAWVVPLDDIGTSDRSKAKTPPLDPSYIIETSKDNYQYGYLIEPFDVTSIEGRLAFDTVLYSLIKAGYSDPGCRGATRVVRLPGSLHSTGFEARVKSWRTQRVWALEDILPAMGVKEVVPASREMEAQPGKHQKLTDVDDPVYDWLVKNSLVTGYDGAHWVHVKCPNHAQHTVFGHGSTSYSPLDLGWEGRQFNCFHSHCADIGLQDFLNWVAEQDGPDCSNQTQDHELYRKLLEKI